MTRKNMPHKNELSLTPLWVFMEYKSRDEILQKLVDLFEEA